MRQNRKNWFTFRVTDEERRLIEEARAAAGYKTNGRFVREAALEEAKYILKKGVKNVERK